MKKNTRTMKIFSTTGFIRFPMALGMLWAGATFGACSKSGDTASTTTTDNAPIVATRVYGQGGSFTTNTANNGGTTANSLNTPTGVAIDANGKYIVDYANNRVLFFAGTATTATRVYGQLGSFTTGTANNGGVTANSLNLPQGVAADSGGVYIADTNNNRVLYYSGTSTTATRVYGQGGSFTAGTANNGGISANSLLNPSAIALDASGVYIVDYNNHRVLYYSGTSTTATRVYGQGGSFGTGTANIGGVSAAVLNLPYTVAVDSGGVYIADFGNNRVLYFSGTSIVASRVYGQAGSFTSGTANNGGISATSLSGCNVVALDSNGVYVSDSTNNRSLFFSGSATTATRVYGQGGSFTTNTANKGGVSASSLNGPAGIATDSSGTYIIDFQNHRMLFF